MLRAPFYDEPRLSVGRSGSPLPNAGESPVAVIFLNEIRAAIEGDTTDGYAKALRLFKLHRPASDAGESVRGGLAPWQKRVIERHLNENLRRSLPIRELAQQVSLSESHFCRAFKESFGIPPHMHIIRLRLDLAKQLMLASRCPLSEIALACGLADQAHLSKLFRRLENETPNAWRRRNFDGIGDDGTPRAPKAKRSTFAPASSGPVAAFRDT